ncbi:hypothetical protein WJX84_011219 [Apatococcus fuscideae]|uniref:F-box domain-containing protein n=1 Tax=Apatococcus fuscideae TaxID=2026836 RepID=A0AAW1TFN1_9CHLO
MSHEPVEGIAQLFEQSNPLQDLSGELCQAFQAFLLPELPLQQLRALSLTARSWAQLLEAAPGNLYRNAAAPYLHPSQLPALPTSGCTVREALRSHAAVMSRIMHGQPTTILALPDSRRHHRFTHQSWTSSLGHTFLYASKALDHEEVSLAYRSPRRSKDALLSLPWLDHPCCSSWLEPADQIIAVEGGASVVCIRSLSPEVDILGKAIHVEVISCPDTSQVLTAASERVYLQGAFPANVYACPDSRSQLAVWQTDLKTLQIFSLASLGVRASITLPEDTITCWGLPLRTRVAWKPDSSFISVAVVGHLDDHDIERDSRRESPDVLEKLYICSTADSQVLHDLQLVGVIRGIHHVWNPVSQLLAFWGNIRGLACQQDEILFFETDTTLARSWVRPDGSSKHAICDCLQWSKNGVWLLAGLFLPECEHGDFQFPDWALDKPASASPRDAQMHLVDPNSGLSLQTFDMHAPDLFLIRGCSPSLSITSCPAADRLFDRRRRCIMTVQQETDGCWPRGLTCIVGPVLPVTRQAALSPCDCWQSDDFQVEFDACPVLEDCYMSSIYAAGLCPVQAL